MQRPGAESVGEQHLPGLVALSASALAARAQAKPRRFGVGLPNKKRHYYKRMLTGMSDAAKELGIELQVEEHDDAKQELEVVKALTQQQFDGYIIVSREQYLAADIAGVLQKTPAPFATVGQRLPGAAVTVLPDWRSAGTLQAQLAMSLAATGSTLLYLTVPTGFGSEASEAFQVTAKQNKYDVLVLTIRSFSEEETIGMTLQALSSNAHVAVIAASDDQLGIWAVEAAAKATAQVKVIGLGASEQGLAAIGVGGFVATIDLNPNEQGRAAVKGLAPVAEKHLCDNGQKPPRPEHLFRRERSLRRGHRQDEHHHADLASSRLFATTLESRSTGLHASLRSHWILTLLAIGLAAIPELGVQLLRQSRYARRHKLLLRGSEGEDVIGGARRAMPKSAISDVATPVTYINEATAEKPVWLRREFVTVTFQDKQKNQFKRPILFFWDAEVPAGLAALSAPSNPERRSAMLLCSTKPALAASRASTSTIAWSKYIPLGRIRQRRVRWAHQICSARLRTGFHRASSKC